MPVVGGSWYNSHQHSPRRHGKKHSTLLIDQINCQIIHSHKAKSTADSVSPGRKSKLRGSDTQVTELGSALPPDPGPRSSPKRPSTTSRIPIAIQFSQ